MSKRITVIGSGVMGAGVAQLFAQYNYQVTLIDKLKSQLNKAKDKIADNLHYQKVINANKIKKNSEDILARISFTTDYDSLKEATFVIENISENWTIKETLYSFVNNLCLPECILGVNTSAISITKIASLVNKPERVIGIHFM